MLYPMQTFLSSKKFFLLPMFLVKNLWISYSTMIEGCEVTVGFARQVVDLDGVVGDGDDGVVYFRGGDFDLLAVIQGADHDGQSR